MKIKKYIMQSLLPFFTAGWLLCSVLSCVKEDIPDNAAPTLTLQDVNNALRTSATLSGSISVSTAKPKEYGFEYSTSESFPKDKTTQVPITEEISNSVLTTTVKDLAPNERYFYRMYATTGATTVYSHSLDFRTSSMSAPQLSELITDSIGEKYARFRFYVEDWGNEVLIEYGISYKEKDGAARTFIPIPGEEEIVAGKEYVVATINLEPDTEYEFRPYAKNAADASASTGTIEGYGATITQKTSTLLSAEVETVEIASGNIGINSVKTVGKILSAKGSNGEINECGFVWSATVKSPTVDLNDGATSVNPQYEILPHTFNDNITGLKQSTVYYICAYAKNTVGGEERVAYGQVREFTTLGLSTPKLEFTYDTENGNYNYERTASTIQVKAHITNYDGPACWEKGIIWSKTDGGVTLENAKDNKMIILSNDNQITGTITKLELGTSYYVRAYAIYKAGDNQAIGYTHSMSCNTESFTVPNLDGVVIDYTKITYNSAELTGKISSPGNGKITERGFVISLTETTDSPTLDNCSIKVKSDESFVSIVKDLKPATQYTVRSYVISELGGKKETVYSWRNSFYASNIAWPTFNNLVFSEEDKTYNSLKVTSGISTLGNVKLEEKGFCWLKKGGGSYKEVTLEGCTGSKKVDDGTQISYSYTIPELEMGTYYYVRAYAKVSLDGTTYTVYSTQGESGTQSFTTPNLDGVVIDYTKITYNSAELTGRISTPGNGKITERGFVIGLTETISEPTLDNCNVKAKSDESFVSIVKDLKPATQYTVRSYVISELGGKKETTYSWGTNLSTNNIAWPTFNNLAFSEEDKTFNSLKVTSGISVLGNVTLVEKGFCWLKSVSGISKEITLENCTGSKKVDDGTQSNYSYAITGLGTGTFYNVRAYAKVSLDGTTYTVYSAQEGSETKSYNLPYLSIGTSEESFHTAKLEGAVNEGNVTIAERGFVVTTKDITPTIDNNEIKKVITGDFIFTLSKLKSSTSYRVRAYAICQKGTEKETVYSDIRHFYTKDIKRPIIEDFKSSADMTSITGSATVTEQGDATISEIGLCAIASDSGNNPTINDISVSQKFDFSKTKEFSLTLKGLVPNTSYIVNVFAKIKLEDEEIVCYWGTYWVGTNSFSVLKMENTPANTTCEVTAQYNDNTCTEYGFVWAEKPANGSEIDPGKATGKLKCTDMDAENNFSGTITKLASGKTYYLWAYAVYSGKAVYQGRWEFTTKRIPGQGDNVSPDNKQ